MHPCPHGFQDRTIRLWNPHKGTFIKSYLGHGYEVRDVTVFKDI
jgi:mitogen-activated protein kinase organizer 1